MSDDDEIVLVPSVKWISMCAQSEYHQILLSSLAGYFATTSVPVSGNTGGQVGALCGPKAAVATVMTSATATSFCRYRGITVC